ncbi:MAG TPA: Asp-tRNA(Asn)/Glu-tRNA(Gln) amidotransferase subunit GatC [Fontimonas sp.]
MSLTIEQVQQVAQLARLAVEPEQAAQYARQLSDIFDLVGQLDRANTDGVEVMAHPLGLHQRLRPDAVTQPNEREVFQAIAPAVENGLYLVPKVIE